MTRRNEIRGVVFSLSADDVDLPRWCPESREDVCTLVNIQIGDSSNEARDLFYVRVATPEGLRKRLVGDVMSSRGLIVLSDYDWGVLSAEICRIVDICVVRDWADSVCRLQRFFLWEYEES